MMDNVYWRMTFDQENVPPIFPYYKQVLFVPSFSEDSSLAGERIGYFVVNPHAKHSTDLVHWIINNNDKLGNISPPSMIQYAIVGVYEKYGALPNLTNIYEKSINFLMYEKLIAIGLYFWKPEGTFYLLLRLPTCSDRRSCGPWFGIWCSWIY